MSEITLRNVCKEFEKGQFAVKDFNLDIRDREFIIFVGPSGCGKSTTLRMIAGLEDISDGELWIDGELCNYYEPKDRGLSMVFQNYALYPNMTVYGNLAYALKIRKVPKSEIDERVHKVARTLEIEHLLDRRPAALSGGQKQRVAIGSAIIRKPKAFLMDEPLSNLDAKLRAQMRIELAKLHRELETTIIYVTHDQTEAMTLGTRIVVMKDGVVQQVDTPRNLYEKPCNLFVAGFIGTPQMNFFRGRLERTEEGYQVQCMGTVIPLTQERSALLSQRGQAGGEVIVGVRPEHIAVQSQGDNAVAATVEVSELMGSEVYLHAVVDSGEERQNAVLRIPTMDLPAQYQGNVPYGAQIRFAFPSQLIHLFDPVTEKSLFC